ncbi:Abi family protein [Planococcus koreensis]|uniref:Abi family protein n=1 Tax=Planococcus koreensis TaxID=112331 RepID=UPI0039FDA603
MKVFASHDEQIQILRQRGMIVADEAAAKRILARENYYALIDGYKEPFLERDERLNPYGLERYAAGTEFGHVYALYGFDRELRMLMLNELLKFEKNIKSKVAYRFSEKFQAMDSFLESANYSSEAERHHERDRIISTLANLIKSHKKRDRVRYPAIREFYDKHKNVPLWVLVNFLSLGQISNFYSVIDDELRSGLHATSQKNSVRITNRPSCRRKSLMRFCAWCSRTAISLRTRKCCTDSASRIRKNWPA